jgi:site-specific DNA-methyltransferase (adenine-specific)
MKSINIINLHLYHADNIEFMSNISDKYFDLTVADPPYGIGQNWKKNTKSKFYSQKLNYKNDEIPSKFFFEELFRISKNVIIWGANYYTDYLKPNNSWIVWNKKRDVLKTFYSEVELAYTTFNIPSRIIELRWNGANCCEKTKRIHPHQKPVMLYDWIYTNYSKENFKVFDPNLGSASSAVAALYHNIHFTGVEIDEFFFERAVGRLREQQLKIDFTK